MDIPGYGDALTELVELGDTVLRQPSDLWQVKFNPAEGQVHVTTTYTRCEVLGQ